MQIGKVGNKEQGLVQFTKIVLKGDVNKKLFGPDDLVVRLTLTNQVKKNMQYVGLERRKLFKKEFTF